MTKETSESPKSPSTLERAAHALPSLAAALLVVSVAYDYSFLWALGLSFDDIPSSLAEHVRSAIVWAPKLVIAALLYAAVEMFLKRVEGGLSEEELIARSPTPRFTRALRRSGDLAMAVAAALVATIGPLLSSDSQWVFLSFLVTWGFLTLSVVQHPRLRLLFPTSPARFLLIAPIVLSMVGLYGYQAGARLMTPASPIWELTIRQADSTRILKLRGMRRFSSFAIAVDEERKVSVIPHESILVARTLQASEHGVLNACRWLGLMCSSPPKPPEK